MTIKQNDDHWYRQILPASTNRKPGLAFYLTQSHRRLKGGMGLFGIMAMALACVAPASWAGPVTLPVGLAPGSTYRLAFVTAGGWSATSANIADYNTEVNTEANSVAALQALGATWSVIGSTATVSAISNVGQDPGVPIYNLAGQLVADDATTTYATGLFGQSTYTSLFSPIDYNESGVKTDGYVWTGSNADGSSAGYALGTTGAHIYCIDGFSGSTAGLSGANWIAYSDYGDLTAGNHLYGISGVLTVPAATPEPATTATMGLGLAVLCLAVQRRKRASKVV